MVNLVSQTGSRREEESLALSTVKNSLTLSSESLLKCCFHSEVVRFGATVPVVTDVCAH